MFAAKKFFSLAVAGLTTVIIPAQEPENKSQQVRGEEVEISYKNIPAIVKETTAEVNHAIQESQIQIAQSRLSELVGDPEANTEEVLQAVQNLIKSYEAFLAGYESVQASLDDGIGKIEALDLKLTAKLGRDMAPDGNGRSAKIARYDEALNELAVQITEAENLGKPTNNLKREFLVRHQGLELLNLIEQGNPQQAELTSLHLELQGYLQEYRSQLTTTGELLSLSRMLFQEEIELLSFTSTALETRIQIESLKEDLERNQITTDNSNIAGFIEQFQENRAAILGTFRRYFTGGIEGSNIDTTIKLPNMDEEIRRRFESQNITDKTKTKK